MSIAYVAGQLLTADDLNARQPITALKPTGTARTSTTVLADDPDLTVTLRAGYTYRIDVNLGVDGSAAADVQIGYRRTGSVALVSASTGREFVGPDSGSGSPASGTSVRMQKSGAAIPDAGAVYGTNTVAGVIRETFWVVGGGTLTLQWAQSVSTASATTLTGSLVATPLA
jgi:hypothetical protein